VYTVDQDNQRWRELCERAESPEVSKIIEGANKLIEEKRSSLRDNTSESPK
jgi:hypothetical protein